MTPRLSGARIARTGFLLASFVAGVVVAAVAGSALVVYVPYATVGAILVVRRPANVIGWLLFTIAWGFALGFLPVRATIEGLQTLTAPPIVLAVAWFKVLSLPLTFGLVASLAIVFPTGRLPIGRWRRPAMLVLLAMGAITLAAAVWPVMAVQPVGVDHSIVMPNPLRLLPFGRLDDGTGAVPAAAFPVTFALLLASIVSILVRYVRSDGVERLQLRWLVTGLASVAVAVPVGFVLYALFGSAIEGLAWLPAMVAFTLPPIAIGIAVLRYRLYEIDRIISRTIGWAIVTGVLLGTYLVALLVLQSVLDGVTQGDTLAVAVSTLASAALFQPVRRRIQSAVDRRFDRSRYDGEWTAAAFAERLRDQIDLASLETDIGATVTAALRPTSTGVWVRTVPDRRETAVS